MLRTIIAIIVLYPIVAVPLAMLVGRCLASATHELDWDIGDG